MRNPSAMIAMILSWAYAIAMVVTPSTTTLAVWLSLVLACLFSGISMGLEDRGAK